MVLALACEAIGAIKVTRVCDVEAERLYDLAVVFVVVFLVVLVLVIFFVVVCFLVVDLVVFFLFDVHPNISKGSFNSNYLSKETCNSIKGFCVILVFLSHCGKYIHYNKTGINEMYYSVAGYLSQLIVVMFFFYSGYGLMQQIIKKGKQYIQSFLFSRFLPTYISFVICVLFYYILSLVINVDYSCKQLLLSFIGWESIGNSNWFMFVTFVLYFIFFLSFRFVKKVSYGFVIFCFLSFLFFVIKLSSSSILSEIWKSQTFRRLIFSSLTYTCENKYDNCYDVWKHFVQFLNRHSRTRNK